MYEHQNDAIKTVAELKALIANLPDDMPVVMQDYSEQGFEDIFPCIYVDCNNQLYIYSPY